MGEFDDIEGEFFETGFLTKKRKVEYVPGSFAKAKRPDGADGGCEDDALHEEKGRHDCETCEPSKRKSCEELKASIGKGRSLKDIASKIAGIKDSTMRPHIMLDKSHMKTVRVGDEGEAGEEIESTVDEDEFKETLDELAEKDGIDLKISRDGDEYKVEEMAPIVDEFDKVVDEMMGVKVKPKLKHIEEREEDERVTKKVLKERGLGFEVKIDGMGKLLKEEDLDVLKSSKTGLNNDFRLKHDGVDKVTCAACGSDGLFDYDDETLTPASEKMRHLFAEHRRSGKELDFKTIQCDGCEGQCNNLVVEFGDGTKKRMAWDEYPRLFGVNKLKTYMDDFVGALGKAMKSGTKIIGV